MLYQFNTDKPESSDRVKIQDPNYFGILEKQIEEFFKLNLSDIVSEEHLMLIHQERKFQEDADLLALDKDGRLFIFELKRWQSRQENILQVLRYGQKFGRYTYDQLEHLSKQQTDHDSSFLLDKAHKEYFDLENPINKSSFNSEQTFVLVTNGTDTDTLSAINYWADKNLDIRCAPYRIYEIDGTPYLQFDTFSPDREVIEEHNTEYYIVNTNASYMKTAYESMLGNLQSGKASAYYDKKRAVARIPKNAIVYLYHTGTGVIAKGQSTSSYEKTDHNENTDEEFYVPLEFEWAIPKENWNEFAVAAWQINTKLNSGYRFRQTAFSITEEMAQTIDEIHDEKKI